MIQRPIHLRRVLRGALATAVLWLAASGTAVANSGLVPHEAFYELNLHHSSRGTEVSALRGRMKMRFEASCDGWRIEQALAFRMLALEGSRLEHLAHFNAFEEADGSGFIFNTRTWEDRELVEELSGKARRQPDGRVEVKYVEPELRSELLPAGTMFPAQHVHAVLAAAQAGDRVSLSTVFDGSSTDSPFEISSVIGRPARERPGTRPELAGSDTWPVRLAYFGIGAVEPKAEFEMSVMLYANGVAGDMVYDYGDFAIDVSLKELVLLEAPACN